jgi:hypothetical protein
MPPTCRVCKSTAPLRRVSETSPAGWIAFTVLLLSCFPLSPLALYIGPRWGVCSRCGCRVQNLGSETWPLRVISLLYFGALVLGAALALLYLGSRTPGIRT